MDWNTFAAFLFGIGVAFVGQFLYHKIKGR